MDTKEQHETHNSLKYTTYCDGEHAFTWQYVIETDDDQIECDEYYDTREQAQDGAIEHIEQLCEGPSDPDYDAPSYFEKGGYGYIDWEERRRLGE